MSAVRKRDTAAGFLLPETLATFTISAAVLFCLVGGSAMLMMVSDRSISHVQTNDRFYQALRALTRDISHISRARWNGEEPQPYIFSGNESALLFTVEETGPLFPTRKVIALRPQGNAGELTWREAELPPMAARMGDLRFGPTRKLDLAGARLRFAYIEKATLAGGPPGPTTKSDVTQPNALATRVRQEIVRKVWPSKTSLPDAILVEAEDAQSGRQLASLRIPLLINADIGCIKAEGGAGGQPGAPSGGQTQPPDSTPMVTGTQPTVSPTPTGGTAGAGAPGDDTFCSRGMRPTPTPQATPDAGAPR